MCKVSVIVPIYNVEPYMKKGIDSILKQSLKDIEVILVDDGSTDKSGKIADEYMKEDSRIKVIHQQNKGLPGARNSGILIAKGEYISFMDPDDWIENTMLEEMYLSAKKNNSDIVVCNMKEEYINENIVNVYKNHIENKTLQGEKIKEYFTNYIEKKEFFTWPTVCTKLYRKKFLDINNLWQNEELRIAEDLCFNINALMNAKIISGVDKEFYHYMRINPNSLLNSLDESKVYDHMFARKKIIEYLNMYNIDTSDYVRYENCKNLRNLIDLCIFKVSSNSSFKEEYNDMKNILVSKEYDSYINNYDDNYISKSIKIILGTINLKMYWLTYILLKIYITRRRRLC